MTLVSQSLKLVAPCLAIIAVLPGCFDSDSEPPRTQPQPLLTAGGEACGSDGDCADFNSCNFDLCRNDVCEHPTRPDGAGCMTVGGKTGVCQGGTCVVNCGSNGDCGSSNPQPECFIAPVCENGLCTTGGPTNETGSCSGGSGICKNGYCVTACPNGPCPQPADPCYTAGCYQGKCTVIPVSSYTMTCNGGAGTCVAGACIPNGTTPGASAD